MPDARTVDRGAKPSNTNKWLLRERGFDEGGAVIDLAGKLVGRFQKDDARAFIRFKENIAVDFSVGGEVDDGWQGGIGFKLDVSRDGVVDGEVSGLVDGGIGLDGCWKIKRGRECRVEDTIGDGSVAESFWRFGQDDAGYGGFEGNIAVDVAVRVGENEKWWAGTLRAAQISHGEIA